MLFRSLIILKGETPVSVAAKRSCPECGNNPCIAQEKISRIDAVRFGVMPDLSANSFAMGLVIIIATVLLEIAASANETIPAMAYSALRRVVIFFSKNDNSHSIPTFSMSIRSTYPKPLQCEQAPSGELKEKLFGAGS